jgi:predicted transposase YbfD/YdcC
MILSFLEKIIDTRQEGKVIYELEYILLFCIFGVCSEGYSYRRIDKYISIHFDYLKSTFGLNWSRPPEYTTIRNIIKSVDNKSLEKYFRLHSLSLVRKELLVLLIHIDGKALRGSIDRLNDKGAVQVLNAFISQLNVILGHSFIEEHKTNEIPKAQQMIKELGLTGAIFTFDALHTQKETINIIKSTGNDAIIQVKENQQKLLAECQLRASVQKVTDTDINQGKKAHGRIEKRTVTVYTGFCSFSEDIQVDWPWIKQIIKVYREVQERDNKNTKEIETRVETSYYISTNLFSAKEYQFIIRDHWGIENKDHYVRDVAFREDKSRIRIKASVFGTIRSFGMNLMRMIKPDKISMTDQLYENSQDTEGFINKILSLGY